MDYVVIMPELHYQEVIVDAKSKEEALTFAHAGDGDYGETYYGRVLENEEIEWGVQVFDIYSGWSEGYKSKAKEPVLEDFDHVAGEIGVEPDVLRNDSMWKKIVSG